MGLGKIRKQVTKDYVAASRLLTGPAFAVDPIDRERRPPTSIRNLWSQRGHLLRPLPGRRGEVHQGLAEYDARDAVAEWYLRQMLGSANFHAGPVMASHDAATSRYQIEHHLFPDMPSNRYAQIAPRIRDLTERYGLAYTTGTLPQQVASAWKQVVKLSLPNGGLRRRRA